LNTPLSHNFLRLPCTHINFGTPSARRLDIIDISEQGSDSHSDNDGESTDTEPFPIDTSSKAANSMNHGRDSPNEEAMAGAGEVTSEVTSELYVPDVQALCRRC
jgi:hypothetical protein